jgi:hypothetical protein
MSDVEREREPTTRQTIRRMPDDQPEIGPFFPSGMSAPEAAGAGAIIPEREGVGDEVAVRDEE